MDTRELIERHKERLTAADRKLAALGMAFPMQGSNKTLLANARKAVQDTAATLSSQAAEIERLREALAGYQSAVAACLLAGGVDPRDDPGNWWAMLVSAQRNGAAALTPKPNNEG